MSQSLRIAPPANHAASTTNTQRSKLTTTSQSQSQLEKGAPSAPGLPDTLRLSQHDTAQPSTTHPLEARLTQWQQTQTTTRNNLLRRNFGLAMPLRMGMEATLVARSDSFRPAMLGSPAGVHADILANRDASVDWEDVYAGQDGLRGVVNTGGDGQGVGWHDEMERKVGMGKW